MRPFLRAVVRALVCPVLRALLLALSLAGAAFHAQAHKASDAYLTLAVSGVQISQRWDIALRDLDRELDLDADADGELRWVEVRSRWGDIDALAGQALDVQADGKPCRPGPAGVAQLDSHSDGRYAVLTRTWTCAATVRSVAVRYRLFAQTDPTHRGILRLLQGDAASLLRGDAQPGDSQTAVLTPGAAALTLAMDGGSSAAGADAGAPSGGAGFWGFVREGVHHILIGTDHVLFLLSLLLPAVLVWRPQPVAGVGNEGDLGASSWHGAEHARRTLTEVVKVVSAFTLAHSITLALAVLDVLNPPSRWVESIIAASVVFAALNNLRPMVSEGRWRLTFAFGLVHGFGFAAALKDLGLGAAGLVKPLLGFNLGVELGQLGIVALFLPLAWALRRSAFYRVVLLQGGSALIAALALVWLVERALDLQILGL